MECLLHIAYKLEIRRWKVKTLDDQQSVDRRKEEIQVKFKQQLGLIVDMPKPGFGSSNDGNTARRFFSNSSVTAAITGINVKLLDRFATILSAISSGFAINAEVFKNYCDDTANLYVTLYSWYFMPASVHRILLHGSDIIRASILPIGTLSEEAQECRNKDLKKFREHRARKCSRYLQLL